MNTVMHIGIDVRKDTYSLCSFNFSARKSCGQTRIASKSSLVIKYVRKQQKEHPECTVLCGYEAGPTGYGLYRDLAKADISCVIMAPTTLPKAAGNHIKTDRMDAEELARHLAWGTCSMEPGIPPCAINQDYPEHKISMQFIQQAPKEPKVILPARKKIIKIVLQASQKKFAFTAGIHILKNRIYLYRSSYLY